MVPYLNNKTYDALKFVAQILLPALGALYFTLADLWNLPNAEEVVGTIVAVDLFLGVLLGLSSSKYKTSDARFDGEIDVLEEDGGKTFQLELNSDPYELENKSEIVFKVNTPPSV